MSEIRRSFLILSGVLIYGTVGFTFFENISPITAFFWTVMTVSTVGYYGAVSPTTIGGLFVAATSVISGLGTLLYLVQTVFAGPLFETKIKEVFGLGTDVKKDITKHTIVCGIGDIGESVVAELNATKDRFVVIEKNPQRIKDLEEKGYKYFGGVVQGDATQEDVLKKAMVEVAKNLILTSRDDANNVFITLTAKSLNRKIRVVATASEYAAIKKLYFAGADIVISTPEIGGTLLANASVRPHVVQFLQDAMTAIDVGGVEIDTVKISSNSRFLGTLIGACDKAKTGALVVGVSRGNKVIPNPPTSFKIEGGDEMLLLGRKEEIKTAKEYFSK